ncbi:hypothetical protein SAMN04488511_103370 [Pedobacter suwonensis]|uniref:Uncharacterized protein n=1 Tax=Pedobacter suwonensis TaxID=332999 RepID=A0A1I0SVL1_9SPHI|nr:hypothetical protein [Pedobacter suwonensis]SFA43512.1 hypothetical protein SAMN04488511_103370 [Pedobacter suwonensis]
MKNKSLYFLTGIALFYFSCAKICIVPPVNTTVGGAVVSFASSKIPCKKVPEYEKAVKLSINAIYSQMFETELENYIKDSIGNGPHENSWKGLVAKDIVDKMRKEINGEYIETYGGAIGWFRYAFYHNIAYDGTANGPILLNRIPLRHRNAASIANTIAHETAHRIGLIHPSSDIDLKIAYKEPPYVIGAIIENICSR